MAAVAPPGPSNPSPMQTDPQDIPQLSWEGDKMFNIYIHDYCTKRGFTSTARELMHEAEISSDATPPINARQGLLFEWWSVFWVLFQAKSNGGGSEDGLVYTHHQASQRAANQRLQAQSNGNHPLLPGAQQPLPPPPPLQQQGPQPQGQQQQQQQQQQNMGGGRLANGMPQNMQHRPPPNAYMVNGPMTNGVGVGMNPGMGGQQQPPQQQQQQQLQPGMPPTPMNFAGMGVHPGGPPPPQPNGVPGPGGPQQPQPGQQMQFAMMSGQQRPMMNGMPPQRGGPNPNGGPPFQSPTMGHAHSPQHNPGIAPQQQGQPGQQQQQPGQAPMAQLGGNPGPSPHLMNRGMLPPPPQNGVPPPQSQTPGQQQGQLPQGQGPPTPGYQPQQQRPPSRTNTNTPRSGIMSHASPSLASRQPPPPGQGPQQQGGAGPIPGGSREDAVNTEIMIIPQNTMNVLKTELGLGEKELSSLTMNEKNRILTSWKQRNGGGQQLQRKDGPSGMMGQQQQQQSRPGQQQPQQRNKRNSTSPGEEHDTLPRNESSPPERKRVRRSPAEPPAMAPNTYPHHPPPQHQQPQQQGHPGQQQQQQQGQGPGQGQGQGGPPGQQPNAQHLAQQQHAMMMMGRMPMNVVNGVQQIPPGGGGGGQGPPHQQGHPGGGGGPPGGPGQQQQQGIPQGLMGMHAGMTPSQVQQLYRINKGIGPQPGGGGPPDHSFNGPPLPSGPSQFTSSPLNRIGQAKPTMMPPPSPAMNGPPKDNKDGILNKGPGGGGGGGGAGNNQQSNGQAPGGHNPDGSPRNGPPLPGGGVGGGGGPSGGGGGVPPPPPSQAPGGGGNQPGGSQQQQQQGMPGGMMGSASLLGMPPPSGMGGPTDMGMFDGAFMNLPDTLDFDPTTMFRPDGGDLNFERDFGQWFNPDDVGAGLDGMK